MSNVIKSNYIYVAKDDKKIISYQNFNTPSPKIPGMGKSNDDGFTSIDYTDDAYKIDAILKQEQIREQEWIEKARDSALEDVNGEAKKIIADAKAKASQIIEEARYEADMARQQCFDEAKNEGYAQGYDLAQRDVEELRQALAIQLQANNEEYETKMCQLEYDMVDTVIQIIGNITGIEIEDKDVILHILHRTFMGIEHSGDYQIKVSADDFQIVNDNLDMLYECIREGSTIEVFTDEKLEKNQCLIETDMNVIDCSLDEQLKNLCRELKILSIN